MAQVTVVPGLRAMTLRKDTNNPFLQGRRTSLKPSKLPAVSRSPSVKQCRASSSDREKPAGPDSPPVPLDSPSSAAVASREADAQSSSLPPPPSKRSARRAADSTDWIASALTRRFGIGAGLAWVGFLAFGVVSEQLKTRTEVFLEESGARDVAESEEVELANGVKYRDLRIGGGSLPQPGDLVIISLVGRAKGTLDPFVDTTRPGSKDIVFTFGSKGLRGGVTDGLVSAVATMRAGGKREVTVPSDLGFGPSGARFMRGGDDDDAVSVPGDAELFYVVELKKVSIAPS